MEGVVEWVGLVAEFRSIERRQQSGGFSFFFWLGEMEIWKSTIGERAYTHPEPFHPRIVNTPSKGWRTNLSLNSVSDRAAIGTHFRVFWGV